MPEQKNEEPVNSILLAEDDEITATIIIKYLEQRGYNVQWAMNGRIALEKFQKNPVSLVITDIYMPEMDGTELIDLLQKSNRDPVLLVISGEQDVHVVLDIVRRGVYDYLVKPVNKDELAFKVEKAFEISKIRETTRKVMHEREILHTQKVDWQSWKDAVLKRTNEKIDQNLFSNIKTSFSQSGGFGGLLSLVPLLSAQSLPEKDGYFISSELVKILQNQADTARRTFDQFDQISDIINSRFELKELSSADIYDALRKVYEDVFELSQIDSHPVQFAEPQFTRQTLGQNFAVHIPYLKVAFRELLVNAFRYSKPKTHILVMMDHDDKNLHISVINTPNQNRFASLGVPDGYEKLVFEPFFRLHGTVDERYSTLDIGIGLTLVDRILRKMNGSIVVNNITDHSDLQAGPQIKVQFDTRLPISRGKK
ncbi:MAG: response regulator [Leptospiraceae bacterium]|nr:response regulator [Leptospiraceae bacterium]